MKPAAMLLACWIVLLHTDAFAQNTMLVPDVAGDALDTVAVAVDVENTDPFVGFQFDLPLPQVATYVPGSVQLTARAADHALVATLMPGDTLRVLSYSLTQAVFSGDSGAVVTFLAALGSLPGDYALELVDAIIADSSSQNILTGTQSGTLTLWAPEISVSPDSLDFGEVPLTQTADRSFTISNGGNTDLTVTRISTDHPDFAVLGDTAYVLSPSASQGVTIRFSATTKGNFSRSAIVESDDPDEAALNVPLTVYAFAVNELDVNDVSGRSGHQAVLTLDIANMESFVGFQFGLLLPQIATYVAGSASLTTRATDHLVSAAMTGLDTLTLVAYSATNDAFLGTAGDVVELTFDLEGQGGIYPVTLQDPIIADSVGTNIISDYFGGTMEIVSPDIWVSPSAIDYGAVSIFDTGTVSLEIGNNGSDTLFFSSFTFSDTVFFGDFSGLQHILIGQSSTVPVHFHSSEDGDFSGDLTIRSNDPNEDPCTVGLAGNAFTPNTMLLSDIVVLQADTAAGELQVENNEAFVAFQCDIYFPSQVQYVDGSAQLTARAVDHQLAAALIAPDTLRLISFSLTQAAFLGDSGAVATFDIASVGSQGTFPYTLSNAVLGDSLSQNIVSGTQDGTIHVLPNPLPPIADLQIRSVGSDAQLHWTAPSSSMGYYRVYRSRRAPFDVSTADTVIHFTGPTSGVVVWTDVGALNAADNYYYFVTQATVPAAGNGSESSADRTGYTQ